MISTIRTRLLASTLLASTAAFATPAFAQTPPADTPADQSTAPAAEEVVVTGSRIARPNLQSASPIAVVTGTQTTQNADITLDTFLNTLPQVNPSGTSTSNNPGNGGQSNINLRGLGTNRNLILIDGRRPMVSDNALDIDLNTIPQGLIQNIEIVTGGAGATYGADAISGVVNIKLKNNFQGLDLRATYSNTVPKTDAREYQISGVFGGNFADGRGNLAISLEYSKRQGLIKSQRAFSVNATSTTATPPVGRLVESATNPIPQAALNAVFSGYGVAASQIPLSGQGQVHFNSDGSLFGGGIFNNPLDVSNFRYAVNSAASPNQNFFPDVYSYNFDSVNLLVLPLERRSAFMTGHYDLSDHVQFYTQAGYTKYSSATALAPTPVGVRIFATGSPHAAQFADSPLVTPGQSLTNSIVPITNPFIPAALRTLLAARTGDDPVLVGSGAAEPFRLAIRSLNTGLRQTTNDNQVTQALGGFRGEIVEGLRYDGYYSWGETVTTGTLSGFVDVQKLQSLLQAADGGNSICAGGYNPFGIQPLSTECRNYISGGTTTQTQTFKQNIAQFNLQYDIAELPAGTMTVALGAESRRFKYRNQAGALAGPIAGPNTIANAAGRNSFTDLYGEVYIPLVRDQTWARNLELTLGYRDSKSSFTDVLKGLSGGGGHSPAYKAELVWQPMDALRLRGSYQHSVRAPNFAELFANGSSFVQAYDPCSVNTNFRKSGGAAATNFCIASGVTAGTNNASVNNFVATPGLQVNTGLAGNTALKPEKADTFTGGLTFNYRGLTGSIDYYNIKIKKGIFGLDTNLIIAACYNYLGNLNPTLSATNPYCSTVKRANNFQTFQVTPAIGGDANANFVLQNIGSTKTSGIDMQLGYKLPTDFLAERSSLNFSLYANYLIDFKVQELPGVTLDYAGTATYFGEGLGTSFPRWKAYADVAFDLQPITLSTRIRYIDSMKNRQTLQFPGESFTGPHSIWYFDFAAEAKIDAMSLRVGVNNAFNKSPPTYAPNVQSGTDPSLYDVLGRRLYVTAGLKF